MGQVWNQLPCTASDHLSVMRLDALPSLCIFLPHLPGAWGFRHNLTAVLRTEGSTCQHFQGNVEWQKKGTSPPLAQPRRCLRPPRLQITSEWGRTPSRQQGCTEKAPNGWAAPHRESFQLHPQVCGLWSLHAMDPQQPPGKAGACPGRHLMWEEALSPHTNPDGAAGRPPSDQHQLPASQLQVCLLDGPKDTVPGAPTPVARPHFLPHLCVQDITVLNHVAVTGHVLLFKWIKTKENSKFSCSVVQAAFQVLNRLAWLVAAVHTWNTSIRAENTMDGKATVFFLEVMFLDEDHIK